MKVSGADTVSTNSSLPASLRNLSWYLTLACLLALPLAAQRLPFSGIPTGGLGNPPGISWPGPARSGIPLGARHGFPRRGGAVPIFFGGDYLGADYVDYGAAPPVVINNVIPEADTRKISVIDDRPPMTPLIIEREGNQWVRRRLVNTAPGQSGPQTQSEAQSLLPERPPQPLPMVTLVFRDGHREDVDNYTIFGGALYHSTPAWAPQQKVPLSALDLPATTATNRQRGLDFRLPNSPSEVVVRP